VVINNGRILLVLDKGKHTFSLPGGGVKQGEPSLAAAARELFEETGISARRAEYVGRHVTKNTTHAIVVIDKFRGEPHKKCEISAFVWWDLKQNINVRPHVTAILQKLGIL
jgi:8-oxo-dGTP pyrophosphatase MutT (NUDIX family)